MWDGRNVFVDICADEGIFDMIHHVPKDGDDTPRKSYVMTLLHELDEYKKDEGRKYSCTWSVIAPEWRIWAIMERLDECGVYYENDFGLLLK